MKIYKYFPAICIFFLANFLVNTNIVLSQGFNSITTPDGINVIAVGNTGKLFRSINSGVSYTSFTFGTSNLNCVTSLTNDVWIAGQNGNTYKTLKTNAPINIYNVGSMTTLNSIVFLNANVGFVCGNNGEVYKSVNGGLNWSLTNNGVGNVKLNSISFLDASKGVLVGDNGTVYLTEDGGKNWTLQTVSVTRNLLKVKYFTDGIIIAGEYGTIITKENAGSWLSVVTRTDSDIRGLTGSGINNARVCGGGGFIRNNLNGKGNFFNFEINPMLANLVDICYYNSDLGFAVSSLNYAIIRTTNAGQSWSLPAGATVGFNWVQKTPNGGGIGNNLCKHPKNRNSAFVVYGNKVYVSRDRGETWTQISTITVGTRAHSFYVSPVDTNVWMAAMESTPDKVVRSTNYGLTWTSIISYDFSTYGQPLEMDQNNPSTFYFAPSNSAGLGIFKSTDNGATFNLVSPYNNSSISQPCDLIVMWDSSNVLYMGDDGADIFKSTDYALTWTLVKPNSSSEIPSMCNSVFDKTICYATTWGGSQVYRTLNHGSNWNIVTTNSGSGWGSDLCHEDPNVVLTGNYGAQAYLTTNGGVNFFNVNTGLSGAGAGIMVPDRGFFLNMQTGTLFKLNIVYNFVPQAGSLFTQVNIKLAPEGLYNGSTLNSQDTILAVLRNVSAPFTIVDSVKTTVDPGSLIASCIFQNAPNGTYYIQIKHRNSIETWSKNGGESFLNGITSSYDFTSFASQAYGNNQVLVGSKYCFYSGDVDRDGAITFTDLLSTSNDVINFATGNLNTDLNGDNAVTLSDLLIVYNNSGKFITKITPESSPASITDSKERAKQEWKEYRENNFQNELSIKNK